MRLKTVKELHDFGGYRLVAQANEMVNGRQLPTAPGWYYFSERYPEDGAVGPFPTHEDAYRAASRRPQHA